MSTVGQPFMLPSGVSQDKARLYWAVREAGLRPVLTPADKACLLGLGRGARIELEAATAPQLRDTRVEHTTPLVKVGEIVRPYLFPQALVKLCRESWAEHRALKASFRGLLTPSRGQVLAHWRRPSLHEIRMTATTRGRDFSTRYYDVDYFRELGNSEFVLSPDGDCPFAYRSIEAALCGAIPVVQTRHSSYGDLDVLALSELEPGTLPDWSSERAEANFERCVTLVTVEPWRLCAQILRLRGER